MNEQGRLDNYINTEKSQERIGQVENSQATGNIRNNTNAVRQLSETERAWLACAIDSEGCIFINIHYWQSRHSRGFVLQPHINVCNTNKEFIRKICNITGIDNVATQLRRKKGYKKVYRWETYTLQEVLSICEQVLPYLVIKREHAEKVIEFCKERLKKIHLPTGRRRYSEKELEIALWLRMHNKFARRHKYDVTKDFAEYIKNKAFKKPDDSLCLYEKLMIIMHQNEATEENKALSPKQIFELSNGQMKYRQVESCLIWMKKHGYASQTQKYKYRRGKGWFLTQNAIEHLKDLPVKNA
jgi:hypothetical protein